MTHLYTILVGGLVIPGLDQPEASAIAWAEDIVIALGTDDDVMAISRGDSHLIDLRGAVVVPLGGDDDVQWPAATKLEVGGPADLALLIGDPRIGHVETVALVRAGHVVHGALPPFVDWPT